MMSKLWRRSLGIGTFFLVICLIVLFGYSANKSLVIVEEDDREGKGDLDELTQTILREKEQYNFIVVVNPAHGGNNLGNVVNDLQEKEITLAVGEALEELAEESDIGIFVIRKEDMDISNESRGELIKAVKPDLVVDLHVNADPENERTFGTAAVYNGKFYFEKMTNVRFADIMVRQLVTAIEGKANGIFSDEEGKYPLLTLCQMPAVSIEMGYLTNAEEASLLKKREYQKKLAAGIYQGILETREEMEGSADESEPG
ncbi:MAG: N-acetylmuramoyl-L-alanine amidase [Lachnospiraceae bacterium]|nr:N-acetylmuramoyl-L-alanine amidase [Lachnospiraceae bacterium]